MVSKAKPSSWQPPDQEVLKDFYDLYPNHVRKTIKGAMPDGMSDEEKAKLLDEVLWIALEVYAGRQMDGRPTVPEIKASLSNIHDQSERLLKALRSLDYDTLSQLQTTIVIQRALGKSVVDPKNETAALGP